MPNLYNVPLENGVQLTTQVALLTGVTTSITFTASVTSKLQASSDIPGILVIDRVDANGNETPTKTEYISFTGVSGSTVTGLTRGLANTTNQDHAAGAIVEFVPDVIWADGINDTFTVGHNADGSHKPLSVASSTFANAVLTDAAIYGAYVPTVTKLNALASTGFNLAASDIHSTTLTAPTTLSLVNPRVGSFILRIGQDGTGGRTVTWFSTIKWADGVVPTLTSTASKTDVFGFLCTASGVYDGFIVGQNL